jgi:acylphosphatase
MSGLTSATIHLSGKVESADFPPWIARHAQKLGLKLLSSTVSDGCLEVRAQGAEEMLHALALGASLGPESVLVDNVEITTEGGDHLQE